MNIQYVSLSQNFNLLVEVRIFNIKFVWLINQMAELFCLQKISSHLPSILQESGHYLFQYGRYQDCLEQPTLNYNLIALAVAQQDLGIFIGMCLPKVCSSTIIQKALNEAFQIAKTPFSVISVQSDIQNYQFPYTTTFYFTLSLIIILTLLVIVSTITYKQRWGQLKHFAAQQTVKIFKSKECSELNVFNGIRTLAMMWVVIGHVYLNSLAGNVNTPSAEDIFKKPFTLIIEAGLLSVDVFFFMGGFFLAFVFLREKNKSWLKYPFAILQRVLRIWPCYIITILIYYSVFMHLGSGPRWIQNQPSVQLCSDMWRSILFVDNFVNNGETMCLPWGWYLQVDFQIFLLCLILLLIYSYNKKVAISVGSLLIVSSWVFNIIYSQNHKVQLFTNVDAFSNFLDYFQDIYIKPYGRWSPYILGLFFGMLYTEYKVSAKEKAEHSIIMKCHQLKQLLMRTRWVKWMIEWSGIALMVFLTFIPHTLQNGGQWPQMAHSLYLCFSRVFFNLGITLTITPTLLGVRNSFVMTLLDTSLFKFLAKISFCGYLVHYIVLSQVLAVEKTDTYYDIPQRFVYHLGILVITCFFATLMLFIVEIPCASLQKRAMAMLQAKKQHHQQQQRTLVLIQEKIDDMVKPLNASDYLDRNSTIQ